MVLLSGAKATVSTICSWPSRVSRSLRVATSQILTVLSRLPVTRLFRSEAHPLDDAVVPAEGVDLLAGGRVPELDDVVVAAGGDGLAVRREGDGFDHLLVAFEGQPFLARRHVPDLDGLVAAAGDEALQIGSTPPRRRRCARGGR